MPKTIKKCETCNNPHNNRKVNKCNDCRDDINKHKQEQRDVANADPVWINMTEKIKNDFIDAVAKMHNIDSKENV